MRGVGWAVTSVLIRERFAAISSGDARAAARQAELFVSGDRSTSQLGEMLWAHPPSSNLLSSTALPPNAVLLCCVSACCCLPRIPPPSFCLFCVFWLRGDNGMRRRRFRFLAPTVPTCIFRASPVCAASSPKGTHAAVDIV